MEEKTIVSTAKGYCRAKTFSAAAAAAVRHFGVPLEMETAISLLVNPKAPRCEPRKDDSFPTVAIAETPTRINPDVELRSCRLFSHLFPSLLPTYSRPDVHRNLRRD